MIWWTNIFNKIGFEPEHKVVLHDDNMQTIRLLQSELNKTPTKLLHVNVAQCWLRQEVQKGHINVAYLPTAQLVADGLTKLLLAQRHAAFIKLLGMKDLTDEVEG